VSAEQAKTELLEYLEAIRTLKITNHMKPEGFHYYGAEDFLLQHGKWFDVGPIRKDVKVGAQKQCFGNSIMLAGTRDWKYIEGYAVAPIGKYGAFPVHHGWNLDETGALVDSTWMNTGLCYFGVEFSLERADDATWEGDACVLEDWQRHFPIFRKPWTGEDNSIPASKRVELLRAKKLHALARELEKTR
jgi:hypothetical protein